MFLVATGTAANALALGALARPYGAIFCHEEAHIHDDECGAPEFFTGGAKLVGMPGHGGKITPARSERDAGALSARPGQSGPSRRASLSQATEAGTFYTPRRDRGAGRARPPRRRRPAYGRRPLRQRARLPRRTPAEMTWRAGVDVLSFGATKNGALAAEAVMFFDQDLAGDFRLSAQARRPSLSKVRFLGAQIDAYLAGDLWLEHARHANAMARRLAEGLAACRASPGAPGRPTRSSPTCRTERSLR